jgi:energy-converting hydrogenase A subunit D
VIEVEFLVSFISIALMVIGALGIIFLTRPLDKVIMFSILDAGFVLAVVLFKYLDVALFAALIGPLSTVVFILAIVKINEIRRNKLVSGDAND